jgi:hypothetical protein
MSDLNDDPYETAKAQGVDIVLPGPRELFLDIDDDESMAHYEAMLAFCTNDPLFPMREIKRTVSPGANWHVYVEVFSKEPLDPMTRIALQAALGSDRKRELLSALRIHFGLDRPPTVFFERPGEEGADATVWTCGVCGGAHKDADHEEESKKLCKYCNASLSPEELAAGITECGGNCIPF